MTTEQSSGTQDLITGYWDWRGAAYDDAPRHGLHDDREKAVWLKTLAELVPRPPKDVLDVGAGTGFLALLLAELGHRVTGIDLAEGMLTAARDKAAGLSPLPTFVLGDAHAPSLPSASFDVVTNRHVMWTLLDPPRALRNWLQLLRPGGQLLAIDGLWWLDQKQAEARDLAGALQEKHKQHYTPTVEAALPLRQATSIDTILAMVRDAGFTNVEVRQLVEIAAIERAVLPEGAGLTQPRYAIQAVRP